MVLSAIERDSRPQLQINNILKKRKLWLQALNNEHQNVNKPYHDSARKSKETALLQPHPPPPPPPPRQKKKKRKENFILIIY